MTLSQTYNCINAVQGLRSPESLAFAPVATLSSIFMLKVLWLYRCSIKSLMTSQSTASSQLKRSMTTMIFGDSLRFLIVPATLWFAVVQSQQYLQEPPTFLKPCSLKSAPGDTCLATMMTNLFQHWRNGVPGLRTVGSLDPFRLSKLRIAQRVPPNLDVQVGLRNMSTYGLSQIEVLNTTSLHKSGQYSLGYHVRAAKLNITCNYKLKGHILLLNLNSMGILTSNLDNLEFYVALKMQPKQGVDGLAFMNVTAIKTEIVRIDKIRINLTNLFGGNRELERSANDLFNDNWRVLFDVMRPVLTQTFDMILLDRFTKIFNFVPAKYLFADFS